MKKEVTWSSPKNYQQNKKIRAIRLKKKQKVCKYTKGEHEFKLIKTKPFGWYTLDENSEIKETNREAFHYYKCPCGKKDLILKPLE